MKLTETDMEINGKIIKRGDHVKVLAFLARNDELGRLKFADRYERGTWTFQSLVTNEQGEQWVNVFGGKPGRNMTRSFDVERIIPIA